MSPLKVKAEELIKDYLLYKGYISTLKTLENEAKVDKDRRYQVDKVMETIHMCISKFDLDGLIDFWSFLNQHLFCRLDNTHAGTVQKLETSLLRMYVVSTIHGNRQEKLIEFFDYLGVDLQKQAEWKEWFSLPYVKNPETNPNFQAYFSKTWQDTFFLVLHNFLNITISSMPIPLLLKYDEDEELLEQVILENIKYKEKIGILTGELPSEGDDVFDDDFSDITSSAKDHKTKEPSSKKVFFNFALPTFAKPGNLMKKMGSMTGLDLSHQRVSQHEEIETAKESTFQLRERDSRDYTEISLCSDEVTYQSSDGACTKNRSNSMQSESQSSCDKVETQNQSLLTSKIRPVRSDEDQASNSRQVEAETGIGKALESKERRMPVHKEMEDVNNPNDTHKEETEGQHQSDEDWSADRQEAKDGDQKAKPAIRSEGSNEESGASSKLNPSETDVDASAGDRSVSSSRQEEEDGAHYLLLSQDVYSEHRSIVTHCRCSESGDTVASSDMDGVVKVWSLPSLVTTATIMSKAMLVSLEWLARHAHLLILGSRAGTIRLFDINSKKIVKEASTEPAFPRICALASSPLGDHFASSASGNNKDTKRLSVKRGSLCLWNAQLLTPVSQLPVAPYPVPSNCLRFSADGRVLAAGGSDGVVRLYDVRDSSKACIGDFQAHEGEVLSLDFSKDQNCVYSMGSDGQFSQWSIAGGGRKVADLNVHAGACGPFVLAGAGGYRQVHTAKGVLFAFDAAREHALTCAPDGGLIYHVSGTEMQPRLALRGHRTPVVTVGWSAAGACLTAAMDGTINVSTLLSQPE